MSGGPKDFNELGRPAKKSEGCLRNNTKRFLDLDLVELAVTHVAAGDSPGPPLVDSRHLLGGRIMKTMIVFLGLAMSAVASAADPYAFETDFNLKTVEIREAMALITVEHRKTFMEPRFELIANQACKESFPVQCHGTVVRLDDSPSAEELVETTFKVDLAKAFPYSVDVILTVIGPNSQMITVEY